MRSISNSHKILVTNPRTGYDTSYDYVNTLYDYLQDPDINILFTAFHCLCCIRNQVFNYHRNYDHIIH